MLLTALVVWGIGVMPLGGWRASPLLAAAVPALLWGLRFVDRGNGSRAGSLPSLWKPAEGEEGGAGEWLLSFEVCAAATGAGFAVVASSLLRALANAGGEAPPRVNAPTACASASFSSSPPREETYLLRELERGARAAKAPLVEEDVRSRGSSRRCGDSPAGFVLSCVLVISTLVGSLLATGIAAIALRRSVVEGHRKLQFLVAGLCGLAMVFRILELAAAP
ncbi:unnamed protein product [Phytomonas sp. EM1]|nr:unnamed protein product [Phytomonas sp. EM1]|eukprot:CCW64568.1 unnamed protein product [Phytomonas sp. isolate EM1]